MATLYILNNFVNKIKKKSIYLTSVWGKKSFANRLSKFKNYLGYENFGSIAVDYKDRIENENPR